MKFQLISTNAGEKSQYFQATERLSVSGYSHKLHYVELKGQCGDTDGPYSFGLTGESYYPTSGLVTLAYPAMKPATNEAGVSKVVRLYAEVSGEDMTSGSFYADSEVLMAENIIKSLAY